MHLRAPVRALLCGAAVALSIAWSAVPARASADLVAAVTNSTVCQVGDLTVSGLAPINLTLPASTWSAFSVNATGTCDGPSGSTQLLLQGAAQDPGPVTCAAVAGVGSGTLYLGATPYTGTFALGEPGTAGAATLTMNSFTMPGNMSSVFTLNVSAASLENCVLNGGTSLDFSGAAVIAFT